MKQTVKDMSTEDCKPFQLQSTDAADWENSKENATSLPLKSKLSDRSTTNRPVLKTIGLVNQNIGRVQPFRAAKQVRCYISINIKF